MVRWFNGFIFGLCGLCLVSCQPSKISQASAHKKNKSAAEGNGNNPDPAAQKQKSPLPSASAMQLPIGTIHMVSKEGNFVLIKSSRTKTIEAGSQIITYGPSGQMSAHLKGSPARKGAYLTADIVDGIPSVNDMVMLIKTAAKKSGPDGVDVDPDIQVLE